MEKTLLILLVFIISQTSFSQDYALWLSGDGGNDIYLQTSQAPYRNIRTIHYKSLTPPYTINDEAIRDTGIHDIQTNASFPINARYELKYTGNFNGVFVTRSGSFTLNKYQTILVGSESDEFSLGPNNIRHYSTYNDPVNIFQWAVILPKYTQPSIANRERIITDQLFLSPENTFPEAPVDISYVKWQYQVNTNTFFWLDFPTGIRNKFPMNSTVEEILEDYFGQIEDVNILRVRAVLSPPRSAVESLLGGYNYTTMPSVFSDILIFDIFDPSPQLLSFTPLDTQCSYSNDGGFTANFDRDLNAGEILIMTLYKIESDGSEIITSGGQQSTTTLSTGNTYNWPLPQIAGNYLVKYQTKSGSTFSSLETSGQFTISKPPSITFSATKQNDVYCNGGSDGTIQLNASGGVGNFKYELNNNGFWIPFTTTNNHTITGLSKGSKTIKVQDGNGCTQKE